MLNPIASQIYNLNQRLQLTVQYATLESKQVQVLGCRNLPDFQWRWASTELWRTPMAQQEFKSL